MVLKNKHALERGLTVNEDGSDLAVLNHRLAVYGDNIAVLNFRLHAITLAEQCKIGVPIAGDFIVSVYVLLCRDRLAASDLADARHAVTLGQGLEPGGDCGRDVVIFSNIVPHKPKRIYAKRLRQRIDDWPLRDADTCCVCADCLL